jgi:hypothetical protein
MLLRGRHEDDSGDLSMLSPVQSMRQRMKIEAY